MLEFFVAAGVVVVSPTHSHTVLECAVCVGVWWW